MELVGHVLAAAPQAPGQYVQSQQGAVVAWSIKPMYPLRAKTPFREILNVIRAGFDADLGDREIGRAIERVLQGDEMLGEAIDVSAPVSGGPLAHSRLVFEEFTAWYVRGYRSEEPGRSKLWRVPVEQLSGGAWRSVLTNVQAPSPSAAATCPDPQAAGGVLIRREHASVEVRSPGGARIVFDPVFRSRLFDSSTAMPPPEPGATAAFVTHSHGDHFDLLTLDWLESGGTTVYVPDVPRRSLLAHDMLTQLKLVGIPAKTCEEGSLTQIGDITVESLPFFGEQPSARVSPVETDIRNWGHCYRVDTPGFSAVVLADSGHDPAGSMLTAISDSVKRKGPIDVVVGGLRSMPMPFFDGLVPYYSVLPVSGLRSDYGLYRAGKLPSATLGPAGMAAACAEAKAKVFLPYAHGLTGYGQPVADNSFGPGPGLDEVSACRALSEELTAIGCGTAVVGWNPGDCWTPRDPRRAA